MHSRELTTGRTFGVRFDAGESFFPALEELCRSGPLRRGVHGGIADGVGAIRRSVRIVGCFTDGHGRAMPAACRSLKCAVKPGDCGRLGDCVDGLPGARHAA